MQITAPHLLIVSGTGQNSGKTTVACQLIKHFSQTQAIVAIKTTHHFHEISYPMHCLISHPDFKIYQEQDPDQNKDSSKMLEAGASLVFYLQSKKEALGNAFKEALEFIPESSGIICESSGLRDFHEPAVSILCHQGMGKEQWNRTADFYYNYKQDDFSSILSKIDHLHDRWCLAE